MSTRLYKPETLYSISREVVMGIRNYLIEDIKNLSPHDVNKLYKYVRRYLVANIEGLVDPLETKYNSDYAELPSIEQLYNANPMLTIDSIADVLEAIKEFGNFA